jgi:hypothetical protein
LLRDNADKLFQNTLDSFTNIITEKKVLRKTYADERARLDSELLRVSVNATMFLKTFPDLLELGLVKCA